MVLQADVTDMRMVLIGDIEFMWCAIGTLIRLGELIQIDVIYLLAIQNDVDHAPGALDLDMVPFAGRFHGVLRRLRQIINRPGIIIARGGRIQYLDFDAVEADIFAGARRE